MENLTVIGCGTMGHTIALNAAWAGIKVKLLGINNTDTANAVKQLEIKLRMLKKHQLLGANSVTDVLNYIQVSCNEAEAVKDASFIIEAIPEVLSIKQELFRRLDTLCNANVVLASNTSGLNTTDISAYISQPERFIIIHFWNPAHLVPLVEVVKGHSTSATTFNRSMNLLALMNKKAIEIKKEVPGFVGNRLQYALFREAQHLLQEGVATKEDIDAAVTYSIGRRLPVTGPLLSADMGGLDVFAAISDYLFKDLSKADESLPVLKELIAAGKFGYKNGSGFYDWDNEFAEHMQREREEELIHYIKKDQHNINT